VPKRSARSVRTAKLLLKETSKRKWLEKQSSSEVGGRRRVPLPTKKHDRPVRKETNGKGQEGVHTSTGENVSALPYLHIDEKTGSGCQTCVYMERHLLLLTLPSSDQRFLIELASKTKKVGGEF